MTGVLRIRESHTGKRIPCEDTTQREDCRVKTEAEIRVTLTQAKERLGVQEIAKGDKGSSPRGVRGLMALPTP